MLTHSQGKPTDCDYQKHDEQGQQNGVID